MGYKIVTEFEESPIERKVGPGGDSGRVYVPKSMIGKKVIIAVIPEKKKKKSNRDIPQNKVFAVLEDSTIEVMNDLPDSEIINMIGSDYYGGVFRITNDGIEYADVDLYKGTVRWKTSTKTKKIEE